MTEKPKDTERTLEEMLRHLMQAAQGGGDSRPLFIGMKIIVPPAGDSPTPPQKARGDSTESPIEVHRVGDRVMLVTEMPGMTPENIQVMFRGDRVFIWARDQERHYQGSATVPPSQKGSEEISFRHGVLEVSYLPVEEKSEGDSSPHS
ncbi:MAG: hypothetical protein A4E36_02129 [Methanoregulaceae archaeon PtaB.Bin009]|jgi:HSP20 family molecular chaperone IbpA|nr:MAG: hypothetical protein A4E36_02129 [Methanoregulaceae archaeon PtaB.Bin009]OPY39215.1 MAG: hypothetical protein A4E41_01786 [Methanoregulaceae archaeon PtaU1.Bin066]HNQ29845.1 hypothetical protein [Methanolinea sp.]